MQPASRRVKIVKVPEHAVLNLFFSVPQIFLAQRVTTFFEGVPEDARAQRVWHDPLERCFRVLVEHPSFAEVPDGERPPEIMPRQHKIRVSNVDKMDDDSSRDAPTLAEQRPNVRQAIQEATERIVKETGLVLTSPYLPLNPDPAATGDMSDCDTPHITGEDA